MSKRAPKIDHLIEITGVYDGWSISVMTDGTFRNRWASEEDPTKPEPGYEHRFAATEEYIAKWFTDEPNEQFPLFDEIDKESNGVAE